MGRTPSKQPQAKEKKSPKEKPPRLTAEEKAAKYKNKAKELDYKIKFEAKNEKQQEYYDAITNENNRVVIGSGQFGTGKSYVALAASLKLLAEDDRFKQIYIIVPTIEAGGDEMQMGYLPGTTENKLTPYLEADYETIKAILDESGNDGEKILKNLIEKKYIVGKPISFLRGATLKSCITIVSEIENFSKSNMLLILSRLGKNSLFLLNGDEKQTDRKSIRTGKDESGLEYANKVLDGMNGVSLCKFKRKDIVRDPFLIEIMDRWFGTEKNDVY